jgi:hypothetical protein
MQDAVPPPLPRKKSRALPLVVLLLLVAFGAGFVPQWMEARQLRETLKTTSMELRLATLHRELGVASHEAQRNNFASAAESASRFFNECAQLATTEPFAGDDRTRVALLSYAAQRDEVMALLAAGDPAARERLASLYLTMNGVLSRRGAP